MLTLVKDRSAVPLVGLHRRSSRSVKPEATVYFTHDQRSEKGNVAPASGVLSLHKDSLKKLHKISNASFARICSMLDENEEPQDRVLGAEEGLRARAAPGDVHRRPD